VQLLGLLEAVDGLEVVTQVLVRVAHAVQGIGLAETGPKLPVQVPGPRAPVQGLLVVAGHGMAVAEVVERGRAQVRATVRTEDIERPAGAGDLLVVVLLLPIGDHAAADVHVGLAVPVA
jgi:hypothetical protein